jgi:hypothetical protein
MSLTNVIAAEELRRKHADSEFYLSGADADSTNANNSAVSWSAILVGAVAAAALSLILLMLGMGLGLSSASPWAFAGASAATLGVASIIWVIITQLLASAMGGYLAGRLRTKWVALHTDEVYFRDTAHGFLAWAVATIATAALLTSVIGSIVNGGVQAGASVVGGVAAVGAEVAKPDGDSGALGYFMDTLFRKDMTASTQSASPTTDSIQQNSAAITRSEVTRIFINTIRASNLSADDLRYVGQLVSQRTGLSAPDAEKRVSETYALAQTKLRAAETAAKEAADKFRKASAHTALWLFISLLIGAFVASLAATYGGRQRDA